ncbi:MAG: hypothetical protein ACI9YH_000313 [Colwellia sp.]|jgi:hypothetical protein
MEQYRLSFARINILLDNIVEIVIDNNVSVSLEMVAELDTFLNNSLPSSFGLLVNKINHYTYSFEAMMTFASLVNIKAIAVINYSQSAEEVTTNIIKQRQVDQLNIKSFSGLDLGYLHATSWLKSQLIK